MPSLLHAGIVTLEVLFFAGWIGSIVVVLISGVEDLKTIFTRDNGNEKHEPIAN